MAATIPLYVRLDEDLHGAFKQAAAVRGETMNAAVERFIREYLEECVEAVDLVREIASRPKELRAEAKP